MNPYEALANAIIEQAAADHKESAKFLRENRRTRELEDKAAAHIRERKARIKARRENGLPAGKEEKSAEEKLLARIRECEKLMKDAEEFFVSDWFASLTELDGAWLLAKIREMEDAHHGD